MTDQDPLDDEIKKTGEEGELTEEDENKGLPSLFKNWTQMYIFVLGELAFLVVIFYFFTKFFE